MDFILCENSILKYLICQNTSTKECWMLTAWKHAFVFSNWTPPFSKLVNMKMTLLPEKKAIEMLEEYASGSGSQTASIQAARIKEFIEHYKQLPF